VNPRPGKVTKEMTIQPAATRRARVQEGRSTCSITIINILTSDLSRPVQGDTDDLSNPKTTASDNEKETKPGALKRGHRNPPIAVQLVTLQLLSTGGDDEKSETVRWSKS